MARMAALREAPQSRFVSNPFQMPARRNAIVNPLDTLPIVIPQITCGVCAIMPHFTETEIPHAVGASGR
jgi:hypothetical protein